MSAVTSRLFTFLSLKRLFTAIFLLFVILPASAQEVCALTGASQVLMTFTQISRESLPHRCRLSMGRLHFISLSMYLQSKFLATADCAR